VAIRKESQLPRTRAKTSLPLAVGGGGERSALPLCAHRAAHHDRRFIRGIGTWDVYRRDIHRFIEFLQRTGQRDLRQALRVSGFVRTYIAGRGQALREAGGSFQTIEREISALTKLSHALDVYAERHGGESAADMVPPQTEQRASFWKRFAYFLPFRPRWPFFRRNAMS